MITKDSSGTALSASYISALTAKDREYDAKLLDNGTELSCSIDRLTITKGSCGDTNGFTIGSVVGSTLVANVRGLTDAVKGKELEAQIGLKVNGSFVYVTMGYFTVAEIQQTVYSTTITAYGKVITKTGDAFTVPATTTLADVATSIATSVSALAGSTVTVTFDTGITTSDTITASMNNLTVYQALQVLASVCGGYAIDTNDGNIKICRFDDTATLNRNNDTMLNLPVVEENDFEITGVLCIVTPESQDDQGQVIPAVQYPTTPLGTENLVVQNQYVTQTLYTNYLATLTGYEYRPATVGLTYGDPRLEGNDVVSVTDINSNTYIVPCHMITHTYTGGFSTQVVAVNATPQENGVASSAGSLTEQLGNISASVISARTSAETAYSYAQQAKQTTDEINAYATTAGKTVTQILNDGETASTMAQQAIADATSAKNSAKSASAYASRALGGLSTVQSVAETLTWITQHGTMTLTSDVALDPTHVYFVRNDATGYYTVGAHKYDIVTEPDVDDIGTYYVLTIDESLNNYVGTHLALDSEGLWLLPASSGTNKVLIATGAGSTYTTAGTYIINSSGGVEASFRSNGATIGQVLNGYSRTEIGTAGMEIIQRANGTDTTISNLGYGSGNNASGGTSNAPYYTFGVRTGTVGNYSVVEGYNNEASGYSSHAEGNGTKASSRYAHAEGGDTEATAYYAHAEGYMSKATGQASHAEGASYAYGLRSHAENDSTASGDYSHSQGLGTTALSNHQSVLGKYNVGDNNSTYSVIIGNGTDADNRSNALTVDWSGNTETFGLLKSTKNSNTVSIGSQNVSFCHIYNSANIPFIFNNTVATTSGNLGTSAYKWGTLYANNVDVTSGSGYKINGTSMIYTRSNAGGLEWNGGSNADNLVIAKSALAYWNGTYDGSGSNLSKCSTGNIVGTNGATMTGQLLTSFKTSVAMGSYGSAQTTIDNFINEVRYSSGCSGSVSIGTAYTKNGITIPSGWYNFMYMPHRSGGVNGSGTGAGDNISYGNCFLFGMNNSNGRYIIRVSSNAIADICRLVTTLELNQTPSTSGLSGYSSRCTISNGGIYTIGNQVFVSMKLKISASLSANNYWTMIQGMPVPSYEQALACSGINKNGTALSAYVTPAGYIVITTDNSALASGDYVTVGGSYLKA